MKKLLPRDVVLADLGFDIAESLGVMQANLHIPAFTKGKPQLSAIEVEETRRITNVRIHVERVIGLVHQKYPILQGTLPIHFLTKQPGEDIPLIDRIIRVCCALVNVCDRGCTVSLKLVSKIMYTLITTSMILSYIASYVYKHKIIDQTSVLDLFFFFRNFGSLLQSRQYHLDFPLGALGSFKHSIWNHSIEQSGLSQPIIVPSSGRQQ